MRLAIRIAASLVILLAALFAVLAVSTIPPRSGRVGVPGLSAPVEIAEDRHGVPRVRAQSETDAAHALGWLHARDRLWQLEIQRRFGAGRLAEILGARAVETDRFLRTIGFRRAAEANLPALPDDLRASLDAYVAGINGFLSESRARPLELRLLGVEPEPFEPVDALVSGYLIAWDLAGNADGEIRRAALERRLGKARAAELFTRAPVTPTILQDGEWQMPAGATALRSGPAASAAASPAPAGRRVPPRVWQELAEAFAQVRPRAADREAVGSNCWVVSGGATTTRLPILANDPHLPLRAPSTWYLVALQTPGLEVSGATLPGLPYIVIGRNRRLAWGLTSLEPDVQDLYVESLDPADPTRYRHKGLWKRFSSRREVVAVRGGGQVVFDVRESVHGPIVTDVLNGAKELGTAVALRWTGLDRGDRSFEAFFRFNRARDGRELAAASALYGVPAQNILWATADGHIGYIAAGRIPIRPRHDGATPVSGEGEDDWSGYIPNEALPRTTDPPRGWIVTANNRVVSERYPWAFTSDWPEPYRARRIADRLAEQPGISPENVRSIQMDVVSYQAKDLLPWLRGTAPADPPSARALRLLEGWDLAFGEDSVPAAIYAAWYTELSKMAEDEAGDAGRPARSRFLLHALQSDSRWCDDVRTPARESCQQFRTRALSAAVDLLSERLGENPDGWRWGRLHHARFAHALSGLPVLGGLLSPEVARGGDASTVNVGAYRRDGSFLMREGPSYRQVIAFGARPEAGYIHAPGQSGSVLEPRYRDLMSMWAAGELIGLDAPVARRLTLTPER